LVNFHGFPKTAIIRGEVAPTGAESILTGSPWYFACNNNRLNMIFKPHQERSARRVMFFHSLQRRQVCGLFSGVVILDDSSRFEFQDITGFAERRKTRF
jgi:hypothetical protein